MPCYFPRQVVFSVRSDGKKVISPCSVNQYRFFEGRKDRFDGGFRKDGKWWPVQGHLSLPCGACMGCRLERSRQWATRMVHEAKMYEENCFITLTFNDEWLAKKCPNGSLSVGHMQAFMKALRQEFSDRKIRVFYCGEYGDKLGRPHYHACLFNFDFPDREYWSTVNGFKYFNSKILSKLWPYGHVVVTDFSFETAAYVARYCTKKVTGEKANDYYGDKLPEFCRMSNRPGIGRPFLDKYGKEIFDNDSCVVRGVQCKVPRYYDKVREKVDPEGMALAKEARVERADLKSDDSTFLRLADRLKCQERRFKLLYRRLDNESCSF